MQTNRLGQWLRDRAPVACARALLLVVTLLSGSLAPRATQAAPSMRPGSQGRTGGLCEGLGVTPAVFPYADVDSYEMCALIYPKGAASSQYGATGLILITKMESAGAARGDLYLRAEREGIPLQGHPAVGEIGVEMTYEDGSYSAGFARACYVVSAGGSPDLKGQVLQDMPVVDALLAKAGCDGAAPAAPPPAIDLSLVQAASDPSKPFAYNPYSLRMKLRQPKDDGSFEPMAGEIVRFAPDVWNSPSPVFARTFEVSNCVNCGTKTVDGKTVSYIQDVTQPVLLRTDGNGEAAIALYLDMGRLDEFGLTPTRDKPLNTTFRVSYEQNGKVLAKGETAVSLNTVAIVEKIEYAPPTLMNPKTNIPDPPAPRQPLAAFTQANGDACAQDVTPPLCGPDRVQLTQGKQTWFTPVGQNLFPGTTLGPGTLLAPGDEIRIHVADLPGLARLTRENPDRRIAIAYPAYISVQIRFLDGIRAQYMVNSSVIEWGFDFWVEQGAWVPYVSVKKFGGGRLLIAPFVEKKDESVANKILDALGMPPRKPNQVFEWIVSQNVSMVVEKAFETYLEKYPALGYVGYLQVFVDDLRNKALYTQIRSRIYTQADEGRITVTTRQGEPILFTAATPAEGLPVPAGQTATVTGSLIPQLQTTDAAAAKRADELLASMGSGAGASSTPPAMPPTLLLVGGGALCLVAGGALAGIVIVTRRPRRAAAPAAGYPPPAGSAACPYPDCRRPLRPGVAFCPYCGRSVVPAAPQAPAGVVCPHPDCRRPLRAGASFCPSCGRSVVPAAPPVPASGPICPHPDCAKPLRAGAAYCPHCGRSAVRAAPPAAPAERRCPTCGRVLPANARFCEKDGTRVA